MAGSLNKVMLIGNCTRDPELRFTPGGLAICNLGIATNRYGQDQSGERKEFTEFHNVVVFNSGNRKLAELCAQYLQKGRPVFVEGRLQTSSWDDKETGVKKYKTEVIANDVQFLGSRGDSEGGGGSFGAPAGAPAATPALATGGDVDPDDIPF